MEFKQPKKSKFAQGTKSESAQKPKRSLSWFDEDKEWADLLAAVDENIFKKSKKRQKQTDKKLRLFTKRPNIVKKLILKLQHKRFRTVIVLIAIAMLAFTLITVLGKDKNDKNIAGISTTQSPTEALPREKPSFSILYPGNKNESNVGEIVKNSPPNNPPVYVYTDNLGGVNIQVSQQQLPERFKENQDGELQKLAESFQATNLIQVDSIKVFYGESSSGVQSLIFVKGNLLVLIASSQKISDDTWAAYISSLHT